MWQSPKRLLAAGALLVLAGTRSPGQAPSPDVQESPQVLPAPAALSVPQADAGPPLTGPQAAPSQDVTGWRPAPNVQRAPVLVETSPAAIPVVHSAGVGEHQRRTHLRLLAYRDYQSPALGVMMHQAFQ